MPCNLCMSYVYIPNSLHVAQLQKNSMKSFRWAPKLTEAKSYLKFAIERFHMTSQISREIWVAMLVFHIFQDGGKSPERLREQPWSLREETLLWKDFFRCYRSHFNSRQSVWSRLFATGRILGFPAIISSASDKLLRQGSKLFGACKCIISPFQGFWAAWKGTK